MSGSPWQRGGVRAAGAGLLVGVLLFALLPRAVLFRPTPGEALLEDGGSGVRYACPMFCVVMDEPPTSGRCPVCGMELQAIRDQALLTAHEQAMIGLEAEALALRPLEKVIRQVGEVDYDENRLAAVTTRVSGILEHVAVKETWIPVTAGQELVEIYADELYVAQGDFLVAWNRAGRPAGPEDVADPEQRAQLASTIIKLRNLGIAEQDIARLRERGERQRTLPLRAPRDGVVIRRNVIEGAGVAPGQELFVIADLASVWILVEAFEHELPWIEVGQEVELVTESLPDRAFLGRVAFYDPIIDRARRTARVRVVADNPHLVAGRRLFQPGQRVDARIRAPLGENGRLARDGSAGEAVAAAAMPLLAIPREAVLKTGERAVAFVLYEPDADGNLDWVLDPSALPATVGYELVALRVGTLAREVGATDLREYYPVLGLQSPSAALPGLEPGHLVVRSGNFLLDSQAQLAGRPSLLFPEGAEPASGDAHAGH